MKRTMGWMLAVMMASSAGAQQRGGAPVAPKAPLAPTAPTAPTAPAADTPANGVIVYKDGSTEPAELSLDFNPTTEPSARRGWGGGGSTVQITSDGKKVM